MSATEWPERGSSGTGTPTHSSDHRVRALPGAIATVAVTVLLWMVSGTLGLVGGGVLFVAWAALPSTYAFAVGQVVLVAVTRPTGVLEVGFLPLALLELGLAGVLVGPELRSADDRRTAGGTLFGGGLLSGVTLASYTLWDRVWVAATVLVGIGALGAYGLHRYELVVLGKVPDPEGEDGFGPDGAAADEAREPDRREDDSALDDESIPDEEGDSDEDGRVDPDVERGETS